MTRMIVLDTETTGLSPDHGHRIIEIGCLELEDRQLTGRQFHVYLNPERDIDPGALKVHGLSTEFLSDKPLFQDIVEEFLAFVKGATLIIHNAPFDVGFLQAELTRFQSDLIFQSYCEVIDTLVLAKKKHPGQKNSLDALCKRYHISNKHRLLHGALLDAELLAYVYLAMTGGQLEMFSIDNMQTSDHPLIKCDHTVIHTTVIEPTSIELAAHEDFMIWMSTQL